jgi:hypothetical protein
VIGVRSGGAAVCAGFAPVRLNPKREAATRGRSILLRSIELSQLEAWAIANAAFLPLKAATQSLNILGRIHLDCQTYAITLPRLGSRRLLDEYQTVGKSEANDRADSYGD